MLTSNYYDQQHYESGTDQKNAPLEIRNSQMSSQWNEYIPVKYNFLEYEDRPEYKPGFDYQFKETKPFYRQEITYMPIPRKQDPGTYSTQMIQNQIQFDYQAKRLDIQQPPEQKWIFGTKVEYNSETDEKRRRALKEEMDSLYNIYKEQYLEQQRLANPPKKQKFKLSAKQYKESERYAKGEINEFPNNQQKYPENYPQYQRMNPSQSQHQINNRRQNMTQQDFYYNQKQGISSGQYQLMPNYPFQQQKQDVFLNNQRDQQKAIQDEQQQFQEQQYNQGMNLHPQKFINQGHELQQPLNSSQITFMQQNQQIPPVRETFHPYETRFKQFPRESTLDQYLYEVDLAKRRIEDTRMLNRVRSEENLFVTSQSPRFRHPFYEAQGLESNKFYAKPNLYKYSIPIIQ